MYKLQDDHWLASFEVVPPPQTLVFPRPKNENSPLKTVVPNPNFFLKILAFSVLSRRFRLSRRSRASSRLIRLRPIGCDRGSEQPVKTFTVSGRFFVRTLSKTFFHRIPDLVTIYKPKEVHSRIFVTQGSEFARASHLWEPESVAHSPM